eukprot:TRINITY_DN15815_c0_g1_i1.p1 TRINITY_DN15815_c0_g1~~TRINITY_DN15815_c0_g1_i1.p1  ORF type:complete len:196 (-),score=6.88 TRINITY_DN15815_c0_g1_i1:230-817(-)
MTCWKRRFRVEASDTDCKAGDARAFANDAEVAITSCSVSQEYEGGLPKWGPLDISISVRGMSFQLDYETSISVLYDKGLAAYLPFRSSETRQSGAPVKCVFVDFVPFDLSASASTLGRSWVVTPLLSNVVGNGQWCDRLCSAPNVSHSISWDLVGPLSGEVVPECRTWWKTKRGMCSSPTLAWPCARAPSKSCSA